jgi:hypothetical protein
VTIRAGWSSGADHDTYIFVPNRTGSSDPFPFIGAACDREKTADGARYPFLFVRRDAPGPGDEVTTVRTLIAGDYEYWIELESASSAGDLTVVLADRDGRTVRSWSSPANPAAEQRGWHVFDLDGRRGSVTAIDEVIATDLPAGAHFPNTNVCPA